MKWNVKLYATLGENYTNIKQKLIMHITQNMKIIQIMGISLKFIYYFITVQTEIKKF